MTTQASVVGDGVKTIDQLVAERQVDNREVHERCWAKMLELRARIDAAFGLVQTDYSKRWKEFASSDGQVRGSLSTFTAERIDWLVSSWLGSPETGFTNMHLNVWAAPDVDVPHVTVVFGTVPKLFFYLDYPPRADLMTDVERLDRYYAGLLNELYLQFHGDPQFQAFISRTPYMRAAVSPSGCCFTADATEANLRKAHDAADRLINEWIGLAKAAPRIEDATQVQANRERDLWVRRTVAMRDPANVLPERFFGKEMAQQLVDALWGIEHQ